MTIISKNNYLNRLPLSFRISLIILLSLTISCTQNNVVENEDSELIQEVESEQTGQSENQDNIESPFYDEFGTNSDFYSESDNSSKFEKAIQLNSSGNYVVPSGKIWVIKYSTGVKPSWGLDSTGKVAIECGGFTDLKNSLNHECGFEYNAAGEKFETDENPSVWYYLNSYPSIFVKEGHKILYEKGCSMEVLNIDQYEL